LPPWFVGRVDALPLSSLETLCFLEDGVSFSRFSRLVVSRFVGCLCPPCCSGRLPLAWWCLITVLKASAY
jgi:hypothetical protein